MHDAIAKTAQVRPGQFRVFRFEFFIDSTCCLSYDFEIANNSVKGFVVG